MRVRKAQLYWLDDTGHGGCNLLASWRILYKDGDKWKPVESARAYGVETTTTGLRVGGDNAAERFGGNFTLASEVALAAKPAPFPRPAVTPGAVLREKDLQVC
jgi:hypothetical protein